MYLIQHYVIKFVSRWFSPGTPVSSTNKTTQRYNCNIVESGAKHHNRLIKLSCSCRPEERKGNSKSADVIEDTIKNG